MKKAQSLVEYVLILILISTVAISVLHFLGKKMTFSIDDTEESKTSRIIETMTDYCKSKNMIYDVKIEDCVKP